MGSADGVPAFRWYDRDLGRVLVANRPQDASIIEARASTGHGLLADDGVSISNLFTGDAPKAAMTMSRLEVSRGSRRTRVVFARFLLRPDGLVPQPLADHRGGGPRAVPGGAAAAPRWCTRGCTARGRSPGCAPSATGCCGT